MFGFIVSLVLAFIMLVAIITHTKAKKEARNPDKHSEEREQASFAAVGSLVVAVLAGLAAAILLFFSMIFTQDVGQSSVVKDITGNVVGQVSESGLHTKAPWEEAVTFDIRNQRVVFVNPSTSSGDNTGGESDGREIAVTDKDGVTSNVDITVRYNLDPKKVTDIYRNYKDELGLKATLIYNDIRSVTRSEAGKLSTLALLTDRATLQKKINEALAKRWETEGVLIDEVALQEINPPKSVRAAYSEAQNSQIKVQKAQNELDAVKISSQEQVVKAQATADANNILSASLTPQVLQQKYLDALKEGTVYVVPEGSTPLIQTK
jgi:regulator of protease activity HflC (stomatin/prohibitin superfamily)